MRVDTFRVIATYVVAILVLIGGWWTLTLYEYDLDDLVKGAVIGYIGAVIQWVFGSEIAKATANATYKALNTPVPPAQEPEP